MPTHVSGHLAGTSCVLSRSCPRVAASMVRRTFSSPSRVDHAHRVMWVPPTNIPVTVDVSATSWRQHFSSVGALLPVLRDEFFEEVWQSFHVIDSQPVVRGSGPHSVEAQRCGSCLQAWGPVVAHQFSPHFSRQLLLQNFRAPGPCKNWPPHLAPTRRMSIWFPFRCGLSGGVSRRPSHITVLFAHFCGFSSTVTKPLTFPGFKAHLFGCLMLVCQPSVEVDVPIFRGTQSQVHGGSSLIRGSTPELLKGVSFLLSCSICW